MNKRRLATRDADDRHPGATDSGAGTARDRDAHRWMVFSLIAMIYFFVYFHRVSTSVIVSDLLSAFGASATALGIMSSLYFYPYAAVQPAVGYLADRMGPRRVICYWSVIAALGCFLFALAPGIEWASAGRALIGFGVGGVYVPAIKAFSQWFRKREFAMMIGLLMSIGNLGAVVATTPLAWAAGTWGWRATFFLIGGITLALALLIYVFTRDHAPHDAPTPVQAPSESSKSGSKLMLVLASGQFWTLSLIFFGIYGTLVTLQGLWATPFLMTALGIDRLPASQLNMLIPVGVIVGAPLFGWLPDRFSFDKCNTLLVILAVYILTWFALIHLFTPLGAAGVSLVLLTMGLVGGGFISLSWGVVRDTTPEHIMGLKSGLLNPAPFFGVAVFQVITSALLNGGREPAIAEFKDAFQVCLLANIVCFGLCFLIRGIPAADAEREQPDPQRP